MSNKKKLSLKQKLFCKEYLKDLNATQAAKRAGYSDKTAGSIGAENLKKPQIQEVLGLSMQKRNARVEITHDDILRQLNTIRTANISDYIDIKTVPESFEDLDKIQNNPATSDEEKAEARKLLKFKQVIFFKDFEELTKDQLSCIESVKQGPNGIEIKLHGKAWTIDMINKHIGLYEKDNTQKQTNIVVVPPKKD